MMQLYIVEVVLLFIGSQLISTICMFLANAYLHLDEVPEVI